MPAPIRARAEVALGKTSRVRKADPPGTLTAEAQGRLALRSVRLPIRAGTSVGGLRSTATAGLVVTPQSKPGKSYLLVNAHVVIGSGSDRKLYSPGAKDRRGGVRAIIGEVEQWSSLDGTGPLRMDAAVVAVYNSGAVDPLHPLVGHLKGHFPRVQKGWRLVKLSRTSGASSGVVVQVGWRGFVRYSDRERYFANQIVIHNPNRKIALEGDSGALWMSEDGVAAAMAFSGSKDGRFAFATPINGILDAFGMQVATRAAR